MSQTAIQIAGPMPAITSFLGTWCPWYRKVLSTRLANVPLARATTLYFSQAGNDSTGNGTLATPYKTLAKAQAILTANAANANYASLALRFRRGDVWKEGIGLFVGSQNNITLTDYSDTSTANKVRPRFTMFSIAYGTSGWTSAGNGRYTRADANAIGWLRLRDNPLTGSKIFVRCSSTALVEAQTNGFYWDGATLHVKFNNGADPNTVNMEACVLNTLIGIEIDQSADNTRQENIVCDGYWIHNTTIGYGMKITAKTASEHVMVNCACYYGGYHQQGALGPNTGNGGYVTFVNCQRGGMWGTNASGGTNWVAHCSQGNHEAIDHCSRTEFGRLPEVGTNGWYDPVTAPKAWSSHYAHTGGGGATVGLVIVFGHEIIDNTFGCAGGASFGNLPVCNGVLENVRGFVVGERITGMQLVGSNSFMGADTVWFGGLYELNLFTGYSIGDGAGTAFSGITINTHFRLKNALLCNTGNAGGAFNNGLFWFNQVDMVNGSQATIFGGGSIGGTVCNNLFTFDSEYASGSTALGGGNSGSVLSGNVVARSDTRTGSNGYSNDASVIEYTGAIVPQTVQTAALPWAGNAVALPGGYVLDCDLHFHPRLPAAATRGPYEFNALTPGGIFSQVSAPAA